MVACFPKQRKPAKISNLDVLLAALCVVGNVCKWRSLPKEYGDWHMIYVRINRWAKKGFRKGISAVTTIGDHSGSSKCNRFNNPLTLTTEGKHFLERTNCILSKK